VSVKTGTCKPREPAVDLVRIISEGTYTSFSHALKEFVSNAFDADATRVDIGVEDDCSKIIIRDDGIGMTLADFRDYYASIARTGRGAARTPTGRTKRGRRKIGRFGIGSLAVIGAADVFRVRSVRQYSSEGFEASMALGELRSHFDQGEDLSAHWRFETKQWGGERRAHHMTEVELIGLHPDVQESLRHPGQRELGEFFESVHQLSGTEQLAWQLGLICPVTYENNYPVVKSYLSRTRDNLLYAKSRELLAADFSVFLNGEPVQRGITLPRYRPDRVKREPEASLRMRRGVGFEALSFRSPAGAPVRYEGYVVVQAAEVFPAELRGILVRLRGVAIGSHRTLGLGSGVMATMAPAFSGEVWVDGLDEALQFDRESFREDHPKFVWFRDQLSSLLQKESQNFRDRSAERRRLADAAERQVEGGRAQGKRPPKDSPAKARPAAKTSIDELIPLEAFEDQREYVKRLIPQINGCWERAYYEACAVMIRRLIQTLIVEMFHRRGWLAELKDSGTGEFVGLKAMIDKVCGDARFGMDGTCARGLRDLKDLGDVAAHDFRVVVRKGDIQRLRGSIRLTSERLLFYMGQ